MITGDHFILETVVVRASNIELNADFRKLLLIPVKYGFRRWRRRRLEVEIQDQRLAGLRVTAAGVARFGQELFSFLNRFAADKVVFGLFVNNRVKCRSAVLSVSEKSRRQRAMRGRRQSFLKDLDIFFPVHGNRNRLAELLVALALFRRLAFAHDRIHPVEAEVCVLRFYRLRELQFLFFVLFFFFRTVGHADQEALAVVKTFNLRRVVVALKELRAKRHTFFFGRDFNPINERQRFSAVL